jgi:hypothetical protein
MLASYQPPSEEDMEQSNVLQAREQVEAKGSDPPEDDRVGVKELDAMFATMGVPVQEEPGPWVLGGAPQRPDDMMQTEEGIEYSPHDVGITEARKLEPKVLRAPDQQPEIMQPSPESLQRQPLHMPEPDVRELDILMAPPKEGSALEPQTQTYEDPDNLDKEMVDLVDYGYKYQSGLEDVQHPVRKEMIPVAEAVKGAFQAAGLEPEITSGHRDWDSFSLHNLGLGLDFSIRNVPAAKLDGLIAMIRGNLPAGAEILDERDKPGSPHIHVEFDTKEAGGTKDELVLHAVAARISIPERERERVMRLIQDGDLPPEALELVGA